MMQLFAAGRIGKDATTRFGQDGTAYTGFSLAIDQGKDGNGNDRPAKWIECTIKGERGQKLQPHLLKGVPVSISGQPEASVFTKQDGTATASLKCWVDKLTFQGSAKRDGDGGRQQPAEQAGGWGGAPDLDDSIPF